MMYLKRIIYRMLEVYKRAWYVFFPLWASFTIASAIAYTAQWGLVALILLLLSIICLVIAIATLICHIRFGLRTDKISEEERIRKAVEEKRGAVRKALREAVKDLNPEYNEEQIDMWMKGR